MTRPNKPNLPPVRDYLEASLADPDRAFRVADKRAPKPAPDRAPKREKKATPPGAATRVLSWEASGAIHLAILLVLIGMPHALPTDQAKPDEAKVETIPIEVTFEPAPQPVVPKAAPPAPQVKPVPEPVPQAVERPKPIQRERAAAPKPLPPKPAVRQAVPAPRAAQKAYERPKAPDLQAALQARLNQGRAQEEQRLSTLRDRAHAGAPQAPTREGAGVPQGNPTTDGSGLSGQLASRTVLNQPMPVYPRSAQVAGDEGSVRLRLFVNPRGGVSRVEVMRSSGRGDLDRAAAVAARNWEFTPLGDAGGEQWGDVTMYFRLQ